MLYMEVYCENYTKRVNKARGKIGEILSLNVVVRIVTT